MNRTIPDQHIFEYVKEKYSALPERPWLKNPENIVLRHGDNGKWFALLMTVSAVKLGLPHDGTVRVVNVKCDPMMSGSLRQMPGYFPGYHMNKSSWLTVLLDGTVPEADVRSMIDMSFTLTASRFSSGVVRRSPRTWVIPANPAYYDVEQDFRDRGEIMWHQNSGVKSGETVFIYLGAPVSAIIYRCTAVETGLPVMAGGRVIGRKKMRLKLERRYSGELITIERLRSHGVTSVRGARTLPDTLTKEIEVLENTSEG